MSACDTEYPLPYAMTHRVGLMGNPSDGFNGKTIAMSISNFWAEVTLVESQTLVKQARIPSSPYTHRMKHFDDTVRCTSVSPQVLVPHPLNDPTEFGSLQDLFCISRKEGCVYKVSTLDLMTDVYVPTCSTCCLFYYPLKGTWEVWGCCRQPARSSTSSAPNKGETRRRGDARAACLSSTL